MDFANSLTGELRRFSSGSREGSDSLMREILPRLKQIAARKLRREHSAPGVTPTDLVGETWVAWLHRGKWQIENREHFFGIVGKAMQNVLTDMARRRLAQRRGSGAPHISLQDISPGCQPSSANAEQVLAIDLLLEHLEKADARTALVVRMSYLLGMNMEEIAQVTGLTLRQVRYRWERGKLWLAGQLAPKQSLFRRRS